MEKKTWYQVVPHKRLHPALRLLGNLALCVIQLIFIVAVVTRFDTAWRWLVVPLGLWGLLSDGRGVALAVQDLRRRDAATALE
ncbi:hypothetical protein [Streptomyces sp. AP-93]|uniref:hypothetical protein n=1 Tax=Streptomyces sp. AP-93 TaxID=2929048 RepID=UPI001FB037FC|nr:hypothetical protein [Streptomyces sp. AP-93]MCJ0875222.1 hypothetical protein [Streptomyces sp. AP-93]